MKDHRAVRRPSRLALKLLLAGCLVWLNPGCSGGDDDPDSSSTATNSGTNAGTTNRLDGCGECGPDDFCVVPCDAAEPVYCIVDFEDDDACGPSCGAGVACNVDPGRIECLCD